MANIVLAEDPGNGNAQQAANDASEMIRQEIALFELHAALTPFSLKNFVTFQMQSILVCAHALNAKRAMAWAANSRSRRATCATI